MDMDLKNRKSSTSILMLSDDVFGFEICVHLSCVDIFSFAISSKGSDEVFRKFLSNPYKTTKEIEALQYFTKPYFHDKYVFRYIHIFQFFSLEQICRSFAVVEKRKYYEDEPTWYDRPFRQPVPIYSPLSPDDGRPLRDLIDMDVLRGEWYDRFVNQGRRRNVNDYIRIGDLIYGFLNHLIYFSDDEVSTNTVSIRHDPDLLLSTDHFIKSVLSEVKDRVVSSKIWKLLKKLIGDIEDRYEAEYRVHYCFYLPKPMKRKKFKILFRIIDPESERVIQKRSIFVDCESKKLLIS